MRGWPGHARCWASAWSIPGPVIHKMIFDWPVNRKGGESRKGSTAIYARRSWPRPLTTASSPWISAMTCSPPGPPRWPTGGCTPRPARRRSGGSRPAARPAGPTPGLLGEACRSSVMRKVTRTATVPLEGTSYAVDPALPGRRVELRYDPEDLSRLAVFYDGRPAGAAVPFVTRRHVHRAVPQATRPAAAPTGIDYLGLVAAAHDDEAGTGAKIDFAQLGLFTPGSDEGQP